MKSSERIRLMEASIVDDELAIECLECADEVYQLEAKLKVCEIELEDLREQLQQAQAERDALVRVIVTAANSKDGTTICQHYLDQEGLRELRFATRKEIEGGKDGTE
jgi:hypothetical protein